MSTVTIFTDRKLPVGQSEAALFGSFVAHMGRCVYTGIYEPEHPAADADGFRQDVIELVKGLRVPMVRYPGGKAIKQTTYYPFAFASEYGRGTVLKTITDCPKLESGDGAADCVSSSVIHRPDAREITVFLTNYAAGDMTCEL